MLDLPLPCIIITIKLSFSFPLSALIYGPPREKKGLKMCDQRWLKISLHNCAYSVKWELWSSCTDQRVHRMLSGCVCLKGQFVTTWPLYVFNSHELYKNQFYRKLTWSYLNTLKCADVGILWLLLMEETGVTQRLPMTLMGNTHLPHNDTKEWTCTAEVRRGQKALTWVCTQGQWANFKSGKSHHFPKATC